MDVTIAVATYGADKWPALAERRAIPSAAAQAPVIHRHAESLSDARNEALAMVETEWIVNLDADDELTPGYIDALDAGSADVRAPVVCYVRGGSQRLWQPRVAGHTHDCSAECLVDGNWIVIGAAVRTDLLRRAGGWREYPWSEDWSTWIRCWKAGGSFELIPDAVYRAQVRSDSRNRGASRAARQASHRRIHHDEFPELYAAAA